MNKGTAVPASRSRGSNLSEGDLKFLQRFESEELDFMDFADFQDGKTFSDPIPEVVPDIGWFYELMGALSAGTRAEINSPPQRLLTRQEEFGMFRLYNWYRRQLWQAQQDWWDKGRPTLTAKQKKRLLDLNAKALGMEDRITSFNLGLIIAMARRVRGDLDDTDLLDFISDGGIAMVRSIRKFDATRGYKFSTYFCNAAAKQMWRELRKRAKISSRETNVTRLDAGYDDGDQNYVSDRAFAKADTLMVEQVNKERLAILSVLLNDSLGIYVPEELKLSPNEKRAMMLRYAPSNKDNKLPTLDSIAEIMAKENGRSYTRERIRQMIESAMEKIRRTIIACEKPDEERTCHTAECEVDLDLSLIRETIDLPDWAKLAGEIVAEVEREAA